MTPYPYSLFFTLGAYFVGHMFGSICNEGVVIVATDGHFGFEGGVFHLRSSFTWR